MNNEENDPIFISNISIEFEGTQISFFKSALNRFIKTVSSKDCNICIYFNEDALIFYEIMDYDEGLVGNKLEYKLIEKITCCNVKIKVDASSDKYEIRYEYFKDLIDDIELKQKFTIGIYSDTKKRLMKYARITDVIENKNDTDYCHYINYKYQEDQETDTNINSKIVRISATIEKSQFDLNTNLLQYNQNILFSFELENNSSIKDIFATISKCQNKANQEYYFYKEENLQENSNISTVLIDSETEEISFTLNIKIGQIFNKNNSELCFKIKDLHTFNKVLKSISSLNLIDDVEENILLQFMINLLILVIIIKHDDDIIVVFEYAFETENIK